MATVLHVSEKTEEKGAPMARVATDHDEIRQWVEARGGKPARVKKTGSGKDPGILRIDFPGFSGEDTLEEIEWEEFFEWFERDKLALLLDDGKKNSRFNKFVARGNAARSSSKKKASAKRAATKRGGAKKASSSKKAAASSSSKKASSAKKASSSAKKSSSKKASAKKSPAKKASGKKASSRGRR